jgi:hypothetical protein
MAATVACAHAPKHPRPPTPMTGYDPPCNKRPSLIPTTNKPSSARGEIFGDDAVAIARVERLVHHAELISLKRDSYRDMFKRLADLPLTS